MPTLESAEMLEARVESLLGAELTKMLRDATDALERLAPTHFETIGSRALDLDSLTIKASAAAALPELMARFRVVSATQRAHAERYDSSDWAAAAGPVRKPVAHSETTLREIPQNRFMSAGKETPWAR